MQINELTIVSGIVIAIISAVFSFGGAALSNWITARNAAQERKEARRKERLQRLIDLQDSLIKVRSELQWLQSTNTHRREEAYGEAYAVMLATADPEIVKAANQVMEGAGFPDTNLKLPAINRGIERIGELINQTIDGNE